MKGTVILRLTFVALIAAALLCTGCKREKLHDIEELKGFKLILKPRWMELDERPTGLTAVIYPVNGGEPTVITTNEVDSVVTVLDAGGYRVLLFNQTSGEFESLKFRHLDSYYDCEAYVDEDADHQSSYSVLPGSFMALQPEILAVDGCNEISVSEEEANAALARGVRITKTVTMKPHVVISTLYVSVRVNGIQNAYMPEGCIDGMAKQVYLTYYDAGENLSSHVISDWTVEPDGYGSKTGYLKGTCAVMGLPGTSLYLSSSASIESGEEILFKSGVKSETDPGFEPEDILLHMHVLLVDQETSIDTVFQVGDLINRTINQPLTLKLTTGAMTLPDVRPKGGSDAGFDANVEDWGDEDEHTVDF